MGATVKLAAGERLLELKLEQIKLDGRTQSRAAINEQVVQDYEDFLDCLPPVVVYHDGSNYWLSSGFHRYFAHKNKKRKTLTCIVRTGTVRDAILFSVSENATHGLQRTPEDKRHICRILLTDEQWGRWSNREIAAQGKVSHWLVGKVREYLEEEEKERKAKEKAEQEATEAQRKREEEERVAAEKAKITEGWIAPGKKPAPQPQPSTNGTASASAEAASTDKTDNVKTRTYRSKHGTVSQINVSGIQTENQRADRRKQDRRAIRVETDPDEIKEIEKQIKRSIPKAVKQAKQLAWSWDQFVGQCEKTWEAMAVATDE